MKTRKNTNRKPGNILRGVDLYEGQSLIENIRRMKRNGEKMAAQNEMIYTEKKEGVVQAYNIRADRFAIGQENAEKISAYKNAKTMRDRNTGEPTKADFTTVEVKEDVTEQH